MALLEHFAADELAIVENSLETIYFPEGTRIIEQGREGNGCYIIDQGNVRIEFDTGETDTDVVLSYLEPGMVMGEFSLLDKQPRSANAYAHTDVTTRWLSAAKFEALCDQNPRIGNQLLTALCRNLISIVRHTNRQLADFMSVGTPSVEVDLMVAHGVEAQAAFESWTDARIDVLLYDLAEAIAEQAEMLAAATVEESGMGVVEDKRDKILFASRRVYEMLAGQPASGLLRYEERIKVAEVACPMGVVLGIIPLTNPVPTMIFKALICVKSRNALVMSCHRNALGVGNRAGEIMQTVLRKHGAPVHLIQWIRERTSRRLTGMYMRHPGISFILATGGPSIVKAAYSSGTPSIGVGAGNAPVLICPDADLDAVAKMVIRSKSFDNGVICGSENNLVVVGSAGDAFISALIDNGAAVLDVAEINRFTERIFDRKTGKLLREVIGQSAQSIAERAGVERPEPIRLLIVPLEKELVLGQYGQEKLAPILSLFSVTDVDEGIGLCKRILLREGMGHTAIIHSNDEELANRFGLEMPASRVLVNCPGSTGCIGLGSGLIPSLTLGCGTFGGTSTTDNVNYKNLLNIKRIAHAL